MFLGLPTWTPRPGWLISVMLNAVCSCPTRRIRNMQQKCLLRDLNARTELHVASKCPILELTLKHWAKEYGIFEILSRTSLRKMILLRTHNVSQCTPVSYLFAMVFPHFVPLLSRRFFAVDFRVRTMAASPDPWILAFRPIRGSRRAWRPEHVLF